MPDARRLESVLARRRSRSRAFFDSSAGEWDETRSELFGRHAELGALFALLDDEWVVGDLGCGTGRATEWLAPFVRRVVAVDASPAMLDEARERLAGQPNVELRRADLEELPLADGELDAALLVLVLHHVAQPQAVLREVARVLAPDGRLVILDMLPHDRTEYQQEMGHAWLGFSADDLDVWMSEAGFRSIQRRELPADPEAKGPMLFVVTARNSRGLEAERRIAAASVAD